MSSTTSKSDMGKASISTSILQPSTNTLIDSTTLVTKEPGPRGVLTHIATLGITFMFKPHALLTPKKKNYVLHRYLLMHMRNERR